MELTIRRHAKTMTDALKAHRSPHAASAAAPRTAQPERRTLGSFFRRETPSTFHRCLAVHIHYAQRASALD